MPKFKLGQTNFICDYPNNFKFEQIGNSEDYAIHIYSNISNQLNNFVNYLNNIDAIPNFLFIYNGKNRYLYDKYEQKLIDLVGTTNISAQSGGISQILNYINSNNITTPTNILTTDNSIDTSIPYELSISDKSLVVTRLQGVANDYLRKVFNTPIKLEKGGYKISTDTSVALSTSKNTPTTTDGAYKGVYIPMQDTSTKYFVVDEPTEVYLSIVMIPIADGDETSIATVTLNKLY